MSIKDTITIKNAHEHNLKNISLDLPKDKLIVITGVSGSGKSTLAFDTIFAEGQRRYIESLSPYARQFLGRMKKPAVDDIIGLAPAIAISQKALSANPRSTVATLTEIYDYLRVLYARVGKPFCMKCGLPIEKLSVDEMLEILKEKFEKLHADSMTILAPVVRGRKGEYYQLLYDYLHKGFDEARIDGQMASLHDKINLTRYQRHDIEIVIDKINISDRSRFNESVENALEVSDGIVNVLFFKGRKMLGEQLLSSSRTCPRDGFSFPEIEPRLFSFNSPYGACPNCMGLGKEFFWSDTPCPICKGKRLRPEALSVKIDDKNIYEATRLSIKESLDFYNNLTNKLSHTDFEIAYELLTEIISRLNFLKSVGLDYLTLDREAGTLAGGEAQRIRLASQMGSKLSGVLYVLDEPTIGLHPRDTQKLIHTIKNIRDLGNTIIVVEHDKDVIEASDWFVELGPGPGKMGGELVVEGKIDKLIRGKKKTLTLNYLRGNNKIKKSQLRGEVKNWLELFGCNKNNLKNINVKIPLNRLVCLTGVSGSGKSTLFETIDKNVSASLRSRAGKNIRLDDISKIEGVENLTGIVEINQSPIGRTPRSNPATYSGAFTGIRELYSQMEMSRERGYKPGRFSFNVKSVNGGGRCESCEGAGEKIVQMHFLPSVEVECDICKSKRFNKETLEIRYNKKNIYDVLNMTIDESYEFFKEIPMISDKLRVLQAVGLGYLELGQSATTLSGGEAQRLKLARELSRQATGTLYLLDEPTVGLHYYDVEMLLEVLQRLINRGNTIMVIEHNLEVVKSADWIIDLGPEGGDGGGEIIATGSPKEIIKYDNSLTGQYLKKELK
jgi:excinuclease ABC subunit A